MMTSVFRQDGDEHFALCDDTYIGDGKTTTGSSNGTEIDGFTHSTPFRQPPHHDYISIKTLFWMHSGCHDRFLSLSGT